MSLQYNWHCSKSKLRGRPFLGYKSNTFFASVRDFGTIPCTRDERLFIGVSFTSLLKFVWTKHEIIQFGCKNICWIKGTSIKDFTYLRLSVLFLHPINWRAICNLQNVKHQFSNMQIRSNLRTLHLLTYNIIISKYKKKLALIWQTPFEMSKIWSLVFLIFRDALSETWNCLKLKTNTLANR